MKTLSPQQELVIIKDMITDFQRKKIRATTQEDKAEYALILKGIYAMKEEKENQIEILEAYDKQKVA